MKLVYTNENMILVHNAKNILEQAGIEVLLKNEFSVTGGGELPPVSVWLELWVSDDRDFDRAEKILKEADEQSDGQEWICNHCLESNASNFEICWNCQKSA